jgi:hypothetical protein
MLSQAIAHVAACVPRSALVVEKSNSQSAEIDALARFDGLDADCDCQMALASARRPQEMDGLTPIYKSQLTKCEDTIAIEGGLEREGKIGERLDRRGATYAQHRFDAAVLAKRQGPTPFQWLPEIGSERRIFDGTEMDGHDDCLRVLLKTNARRGTRDSC